jgi:hypothetical protein
MENKTVGDLIFDEQVERGAAALRAHQMAGRFTVSWENIPKGQKKKWITAAAIVLTASREKGSTE